MIFHHWKNLDHIKLLMKEVLILAVRIFAEAGVCRHRTIALIDSSVSIGASAKIPSSSSDLKRRIQDLVDHMIAAGIELLFTDVPSYQSPVDAFS